MLLFSKLLKWHYDQHLDCILQCCLKFLFRSYLVLNWVVVDQFTHHVSFFSLLSSSHDLPAMPNVCATSTLVSLCHLVDSYFLEMYLMCHLSSNLPFWLQIKLQHLRIPESQKNKLISDP